MRILGAGIFLSLLAGKMNFFKHMLLTETIAKTIYQKWRMRILG